MSGHAASRATEAAAVAARATRAPVEVPDASGVPRRIRTTRVWFRMVYAILNGIMVWLVYETSGSALWSSPDELDGEVASGYFLVLAFSWIAYFLVQGTDPGYIWDAELNEAERRVRELEKAARERIRRGRSLGARDGFQALPTNQGAPTASGAGLGHDHDHDHDLDLDDVVFDADELRREVDREMARRAREAAREEVTGMLGSRAPAAPAVSAAASASASASDTAPLASGVLSLDGDLEGTIEVRGANGVTVRVKPPHPGVPVRAQYCSRSQMWVHGFDHFCGILGTSIGERNHCRFWWFLFGETAALSFSIGLVHSSFQRSATYADWFANNWGAFWLDLVLWGFLAFVGSLLLVHTWMAMTNSTGYEMFKGSENVWYLRHFRMCDLPFSEGLLRNVRGFCCLRDGVCSSLYKREWKARTWPVPAPYDRYSENVCENIWENKYWSCC